MGVKLAQVHSSSAAPVSVPLQCETIGKVVRHELTHSPNSVSDPVCAAIKVRREEMGRSKKRNEVDPECIGFLCCVDGMIVVVRFTV